LQLFGFAQNTDFKGCPMNKMLIIAIAICFSILYCVDSSIYANSITIGEFAYAEATDDVLEERLQNLYSEVDARLTADVKKYIRQYTVQYRHSAEQILGRASVYFPLFEEKLRDQGIPDEIKALAIVESRLNPKAVSPLGAVGLWQFIKSTANVYDLKQSKYVDDRRNPEKSTVAAAEFLADLHKRYDDWTLVLAAYNCGPGNVNKAIRKAGKSDYWSIRKYLPKETQQYIPKFIAVNYLINYYYAHDLVPDQPSHHLSDIASAKVYKSISFKEIEKNIGIDIEYIKELNPQYIKNHIPNNDGRHVLRLPFQSLLELAETEKTVLEIESPHQSSLIIPQTPKIEREILKMDVTPIVNTITVKKLESLTHNIFTGVESQASHHTPMIKNVMYGHDRSRVKHNLNQIEATQINASLHPHIIKRVSTK